MLKHFILHLRSRADNEADLFVKKKKKSTVHMYIDMNATSSKYICPEKYLELSILHIQKNKD